MALEEAEGHASNIRRILVFSAILQLLHIYYGHTHAHGCYPYRKCTSVKVANELLFKINR